MTLGRESGLRLLLFAATVVLAVMQQWTATDLMWSLWISSLTVGYSIILVSIAAMVLRGDPSGFLGRGGGSSKPSRDSLAGVLPLNLIQLIAVFSMVGFNRGTLLFGLGILVSSAVCVGSLLHGRVGFPYLPRPDWFVVRFVVLLPAAAFMLGFFTVHFLGFHFVHGIFLNGFFPLLDESPFGKTMDETARDFGAIVRTALIRYWPFVLASALSDLRGYLRAPSSRGGDAFLGPYKNVARMHLMIFVFAGLGAAGLTRYGLYVALVLYFFPVGALLCRRRKGGQNPAMTASAPDGQVA